MQELIGVVLITCGNRQLTLAFSFKRCSRANTSGCTFEKIDLLPSVVSGSRQSERRVYVIGDGVEAHADVSRVVVVQHPVVKPPVLASLTEV